MSCLKMDYIGGSQKDFFLDWPARSHTRVSSSADIGTESLIIQLQISYYSSNFVTFITVIVRIMTKRL